MNTAALHYLRNLVLERSGICISEDRGYIFDARLQPVMRQFGTPNASDLASRIRAGEADLEHAVIEAMTTNETYFFRDTVPFDQFRDVLLPGLVAARSEQRRLRMWSAACATGQEAYSLAIILHEARDHLLGWSTRIVGTDISHAVLSRAEQGLYTQFEVQRGLPVHSLMSYFRKQGDRWRITGAPASMVTFRQHNLVHDAPLPGPFDVIFCRNVLIYFDLETRTEVLSRLRSVLAPDGYLVLGVSETMNRLSRDFQPEPECRGVYRPRSAPFQQTA